MQLKLLKLLKVFPLILFPSFSPPNSHDSQCQKISLTLEFLLPNHKYLSREWCPYKSLTFVKASSLLQDLTLKIFPSLIDRSQCYFSLLIALETYARQTEQPDRPHAEY